MLTLAPMWTCDEMEIAEMVQFGPRDDKPRPPRYYFAALCVDEN